MPPITTAQSRRSSVWMSLSEVCWRRCPEMRSMLIASDHGNIEETRSGHTRNAALCLVNR